MSINNKRLAAIRERVNSRPRQHKLGEATNTTAHEEIGWSLLQIVAAVAAVTFVIGLIIGVA